MDKYMREELKEAGEIAFFIIVLPCVLAAVILGLLFLWLPLGVAFVTVFIVAVVVGRLRDGAAERRKWDQRSD